MLILSIFLLDYTNKHVFIVNLYARGLRKPHTGPSNYSAACRSILIASMKEIGNR